MTPTRAVFRQLYYESQQILDTYDYLPDANAKYPFCFVDYGTNSQQQNSDLVGQVVINVHWFSTPEQVSTVDSAIAKFHDRLIKIDSFLPYHMQLTNWIDRPQPDPPDAPNIKHFIAEVTILYTRKGA